VSQDALPIQIKLKDPSQFPHPKPISPQAWGTMRPYTYHKLGLLISCSSPYNTPSLAIWKGPNKWRLAQDLLLIDEVVISLHPIVPNPYTLLAQISSKAQYYSVLDLKDAFFYILKCKVFNVQEYTQN
jgi:hypothetical protein